MSDLPLTDTLVEKPTVMSSAERIYEHSFFAALIQVVHHNLLLAVLMFNIVLSVLLNPFINIVYRATHSTLSIRAGVANSHLLLLHFKFNLMQF